MTKKEKVLERIKNALKLQESSNSNEVGNAARMVAKLMQQYGISEEDVKNSEEDIEKISETFVTTKKHNFWATLGRYVADFCNCRSVYSRKYIEGKRTKIVKFFGHESDLLIAEYLFTFCVRYVEQQYTKAKKEFIAPDWYQSGDKTRWSNEFRYNCVAGIGSKLKEIKQSSFEENPQAGLVLQSRGKLVDQWVNTNLTIRTVGSTGYHHNAGGYSAGQSINIRSAVNGSQLRIG